MRDVVGNGGNEGFGVHGWKRFYASGDEVGALLEFSFEGGVILVEEPVDGSDQTDDLFLGHFHAAANRVGVGRIVLPGGVDEILATQEQAIALGTAETLATGESDEIEAHLGVIPEIGNWRNIGGGIVEAGNVVLVSDADPIFTGDFAVFGGIEELGHDGLVGKGLFVLLHSFDFDELSAAIADGVVVVVAMGFLDN